MHLDSTDLCARVTLPRGVNSLTMRKQQKHRLLLWHKLQNVLSPELYSRANLGEATFIASIQVIRGLSLSVRDNNELSQILQRRHNRQMKYVERSDVP